jgi:hypothetical protein
MAVFREVFENHMGTRSHSNRVSGNSFTDQAIFAPNSSCIVYSQLRSDHAPC